MWFFSDCTDWKCYSNHPRTECWGGEGADIPQLIDLLNFSYVWKPLPHPLLFAFSRNTVMPCASVSTLPFLEIPSLGVLFILLNVIGYHLQKSFLSNPKYRPVVFKMDLVLAGLLTGNLLEKQTLGSNPRPTKSDILFSSVLVLWVILTCTNIWESLG